MSELPEPRYLCLGELIEALEAELAKGDRRVPLGFTEPHSYRGYYEQLAFEPAANVLVSDMLADAKRALDATYPGYKGGDFTMTKWTEVWLANYGETGEALGSIFLTLLLSPSAAQEAGSNG